MVKDGTSTQEESKQGLYRGPGMSTSGKKRKRTSLDDIAHNGGKRQK